MSFPRHGQYKPSGLKLLGDVPMHWERTALKYMGEYQNGYPFKPEDRAGQGLPIIRISQLSGDTEPNLYDGTLDDRVFVQDGDLLFSWSATIDSFIWTGGPAWLNQHIFKVTPSGEAHKGFLFYVIKHIAPKLAEFDAHGSTMRHIKKESLGERIFVPSVEEQAKVATFLDRETAKIDSLVEEQRRLIELLKEKRQAVIAHAVTKGLDQSVPTRDSGVEWLGLIPKHWDNGTLTRVADRVVVGIAEAATHAYADEGVAILRSTNIRAGKIIGEVLYVTPEFAEGRATKLINAGDLVTVRTGNAGVTAVVPESLDGCQCFTMLITSLSKLGLSAFYCYALNSLPSQRYFSLEGWGPAQVNISVPILKALPVAIPTLIEQHAIVEYLDGATAKLDELVAEAESAMRLLGERRSTLISAAVTGKIDVRGLAPQPEGAAA